jgi:elongator complex protein 3
MGNKKNVQHSGLGQRLIKEAENIARKNKYAKMVIISGIGVRGYYKKFGYKLSKTYMIKNL